MPLCRCGFVKKIVSFRVPLCNLCAFCVKCSLPLLWRGLGRSISQFRSSAIPQFSKPGYHRSNTPPPRKRAQMQLGMTEMIFIFLLALVIFGPKKLPEIGRQLGKAMNEFKRASNEFRSQLEDEIRQIDAAEQAKKLAAPAESAEPAHPAPRDAIEQAALPGYLN